MDSAGRGRSKRIWEPLEAAKQLVAGMKSKGLVVRGGAFHNKIVYDVVSVLQSHGWEVETEFRCQRNGVTTVFDVYAVKDGGVIAVEVETSVRHVVDNARKAQAVGVEVWVVVPSRRLKRTLEIRLHRAGLTEVRMLMACECGAYCHSGGCPDLSWRLMATP